MTANIRQPLFLRALLIALVVVFTSMVAVGMFIILKPISVSIEPSQPTANVTIMFNPTQVTVLARTYTAGITVFVFGAIGLILTLIGSQIAFIRTYRHS